METCQLALWCSARIADASANLVREFPDTGRRVWRGNAAVLLIPTVDPFVGDVAQLRASDAMFDGVTPEDV